jgi:YfiH family protein
VTLRYACLDSAWLVHGTAVFKDRGFERPDSAWRGRVAGFISGNISPAPDKIVIPVQVHGNRVVRVRAGGEACETPACDGLVTTEPGVMIGVNTADCVPVMAVCESPRVVGVAHCGWKGTAAGMTESFLRELRAAGADLESAKFLIGASVGACCYAVGDDFLSAFSGREAAECARMRGGETRFDLKRLVRMRLLDEGIDREMVFTDNTCTSCESDSLCSYRADGETCGRMYSFAMIASPEAPRR